MSVCRYVGMSVCRYVGMSVCRYVGMSTQKRQQLLSFFIISL
ncbi:hypothetical protein PCIT_a0063 [Pseudoalteromonas citrea]|uniref:Uncharacterized protein n=2 Tax=Pseudoalteromonas citrea TaxID=43655 RepID=A0AAD4AK19_9GAMM|nr:hypothetical protein PCIT_a0063 [Pseudoalteromonas citrea]